MDDSYLVIARRYRPQKFSDVIGQEAVVRTLKNALLSGRISHAYLFAGSRGTGKTSIARLYAKALNCTSLLPSGEPCNSCLSCIEITEGRSLDVQEIDGASHRGIDHIRALTESASYAPACGRYKIYLIDEVHMLTKEAFNALLKTLEEPPPSVKFFFATTEPHKIPTTIISRCQRFNLHRLSQEAIVAKLQRIADDMNIRAEAAALRHIAGYADGGLRDAESLLDQVITFSEGHIREEIVEEVFGIAPIEWLLELDRAILTADIRVAYTISDRVFHEGKDIGHFIDDITDHYRTLLLMNLRIPQPREAFDESLMQQLRSAADKFSQETLLELLNLLAEAQRTLKTAASQRFLLEWLLLNIVRIQRKVPLPLIVRKLFELQPQIVDSFRESTGQDAVAPAVPCSPPPVVQPTPPAPVAHSSAPTATKRASRKTAEAAQPRSMARQKSQNDGTAVPPPTAELPTTPVPAPSTEQQTTAVAGLTTEQENARQENMIRFAAVELGATIVTTP